MIYCTNIPKSASLALLERQGKEIILAKDGKRIRHVILADTVQKIAYVMDPETREIECIREFEYEIVEPPAPPPVDRTKIETIGGTPIGKHEELKENGQQKDYVVLSAEERAKGFVRPVRRSYKHLKCGVVTTMGLAIAETYARDPKFYGSTFCTHCGTHLPVGEHGEFVWAETNEKVGT